MLTLGSVGFAAPWALLALGLLPLVWLLLKVMPPAPRRVVFPPLRLLAGLTSRDRSAARPPPWLVVLRFVLVVLLVVAAARPVLEAGGILRGQGPLVLILDNGWASASDWRARRDFARNILAEAERVDRAVALLLTAARETPPPPLKLLSPESARAALDRLQPMPWGTDRAAALEPLDDLPDGPPGHAVWLTDGLDDGNAEAVWDRLRDVGVATEVRAGRTGPWILRPPETGKAGLRLGIERPADGPAARLHLRAFSADGRLLTRESVEVPAGTGRQSVSVDLPSELMLRIARLDLEDTASAATTVLIDERWRRRPVGIVAPEAEGDAPLLGGAHYVSRALEPYTEVRRGSVSELLGRELALLVLADPGPLVPDERARIEAWMEKGGVVLRFAGPHLARSAGGADDGLLPVRLRGGGRDMGGALSWRRPASLAPFPVDGPFLGLDVPSDIRVRRQVLAEPGSDPEAAVWARLSDGTPLVTAVPKGRGRLILVHTAADPTWSDLPYSSLFVDLLRRILDLGRGVATEKAVPLAPLEILDGFGRSGAPTAGVRVLPAGPAAVPRVGPGQPPGIYGGGDLRRALNLSAGLAAPERLAEAPAWAETRTLGTEPETDLSPWLLTTAAGLALADMLAGLWLRGLLRRSMAAAVLSVLLAGQALAADVSPLQASRDTRLAYVVTGDAEVDAVSRAGLFGLGVVVNRRTAAFLAAPVGVDPARDELSFYPLIYWPLTPGGTRLDEAGAARVRHYLDHGGVILFDGRDAVGGTDGQAGLAELAEALGIPPLEPVPSDHVLGRAYYLLERFPGRWSGGTVWIEAAGERVNDGVSPVIAGSHDWAGAWAVDDELVPLFPVVPGGERQRELAYRFGVNLLMYTLTGNYKADQVHLPAIMERLGR